MLTVKSYRLPDSFWLNTEVENYFYKKIENKEVIHSVIDDGYECYVRETSEPGVYTYGAIQLRDSYDHKAGYTWSSRCSVMNGLFGTQLTEVSINSSSYAMDINVLKTLLEEHTGKKFKVTNGKCWEEDEISYRLEEI